jgi:Insertion element 4 transposase N-terminal
MEHTGVVAGSGALTDWISLGVLASSVPRDVVDDAIEVTGKGARRAGGKLPPHVMVYFVMALALFAEDDYEEVAARLARRAVGPAFPPEHSQRLLAQVKADITSSKHLNPGRRHRTCPRAIKRGRHNSYRVKKPGDKNIRHDGPATIRLANPVKPQAAA